LTCPQGYISIHTSRHAAGFAALAQLVEQLHGKE
jgi:hypothetical protein